MFFNTAISAICIRGIIGRGECAFQAMFYTLQYAFAVTSRGGFILGLPSIPVEKAKKEGRGTCRRNLRITEEPRDI